MADNCRLWCPICQWVHVDPRDIALILARAVSPPDILVSHCPKCGERLEQVASADTIHKLRVLGVKEDITPKEMFEHGEGPPLTSDDLLDLTLALYRDDVLNGAA